MEKLVSFENFSLSFKMYDRGFEQKLVPVIKELNLCACAGEILAIIGGSGSGKSLLAHSLLGILPQNAVTSGIIKYDEIELTKKSIKPLRNKMAFVPQSISFLDPLMKVGKQVIGISKNYEKRKAVFKRYGLDEKVSGLYPHQLSGGMARRILIAAAVISDARLIIADEPTPGLSRELSEETIRNFRHLADEGRCVILITHDIDLAISSADRIAVFYGGKILETAASKDFQDVRLLRHPYTKALWNAMPQNGFRVIPMGEVV